MTVPGSRSTITSENIAHKNGACDVCTVSTKDKGMGLRMGYGLKVEQV